MPTSQNRDMGHPAVTDHSQHPTRAIRSFRLRLHSGLRSEEAPPARLFMA